MEGQSLVEPRLRGNPDEGVNQNFKLPGLPVAVLLL